MAFLSPIWQGVVINLLTGEDESTAIRRFLQNESNKEILYYWITPILLILSLIAALKQQKKRPKIMVKILSLTSQKFLYQH
ncbi:MAG: hypothetical protein IPG79_14335 [Saprospiraceae bacterium]|nr:hypothetical protein [Saprospiraceae bacterium]